MRPSIYDYMAILVRRAGGTITITAEDLLEQRRHEGDDIQIFHEPWKGHGSVSITLPAEQLDIQETATIVPDAKPAPSKALTDR